jgi:hypothetical protein
MAGRRQPPRAEAGFCFLVSGFLVPQSDRAGGDRDLGPNIHRVAKLHTNAKSDRELLQV